MCLGNSTTWICAHCGRPIAGAGVWAGSLVYHQECTESPYKQTVVAAGNRTGKSQLTSELLTFALESMQAVQEIQVLKQAVAEARLIIEAVGTVEIEHKHKEAEAWLKKYEN